MNSIAQIIRCFILLLAAAPIAPAQSLRYGFQFGPSLPQGDLDRASLSLGFTGGISVLIDLGKGHTIRPRVDHSNWSGDEGTGIFGPPDTEARAYVFGADYLFHFSGQSKGFYLLAGLGYQKSTVINRGYFFGSVPPDGWTRSGNGGAVAYAFGLGRQHSDLFATELRYTASRPTIGGAPMRIDTLNLGFNLHWGR